MPTEPNLTIEELISQFIDETIKLAGFGDLGEDFQKEYKEKLEIALHKKIGTSLQNMLKDEELEEFAKLLQANPDISNEEIFKFYESKIPDLPQKIFQVMLEFQRNFVGTSVQIQKDVGMGT